MHNLALALHQNGYRITGSDDEIAEPSRTRLAVAGLLPDTEGWSAEKITKQLDGVVLGMHARIDNPELIRARELGIPIYSFPEFLYEHSRNKLRVVIGGSHGKTTITAMVMHVLKNIGFDFDYMVGAKLEGFETMVRLSNAPVIILEGDEYLSSPVDRRPKFHLYQADIGVISGIAWDHINVFPTLENYTDQFRIFADNIPDKGALIYCSSAEEVKKVVENSVSRSRKIPYSLPAYIIENGTTRLITENGDIALNVFGTHNLFNLEAAKHVCKELGVKEATFYQEIKSFSGASRRLELLARNDRMAVYRDFAHSPSKLNATLKAVREQYPKFQLIACMELHTFSSLSKDFLSQYVGSMNEADVPIVFYNPLTLEHKKLAPLTEDSVRSAFKNERILIYTDSGKLEKDILAMPVDRTVILMMSSGNFNNLDLFAFAEKLKGKSVSVNNLATR